MNVILSVKPKYARAIIDGEKRYEFRKVIFKRRDIERVFIYASSPQKRILGSFAVGQIIHEHPRQLWERCNGSGGIGKEAFFEYFRGKETGYAIGIENLKTFDEPVDPRSSLPAFNAPQSFCYCDRDPSD